MHKDHGYNYDPVHDIDLDNNDYQVNDDYACNDVRIIIVVKMKAIVVMMFCE